MKMNQAQFSQLLGVHPITVSKWERGESQPSPYQNSLLTQFQQGARNQEVRNTVLNVLIGVGVAVALALLLKHLLTKK
jgi:putative transcriptional regulator